MRGSEPLAAVTRGDCAAFPLRSAAMQVFHVLPSEVIRSDLPKPPQSSYIELGLNHLTLQVLIESHCDSGDPRNWALLAGESCQTREAFLLPLHR